MRKPAGMSFEDFIDRQIREAQAKGAFDNLPGKGKPLPDLDKAFDTGAWLAAKLKRENLGAPLPASLQLRKTVEQKLAALLLLKSESALLKALDALQAEVTRSNSQLLDGPSLPPPRVDKALMLRLWRARHGTR